MSRLTAVSSLTPGVALSWAEASEVTTFVFEAFDEPWKGKGTEGPTSPGCDTERTSEAR